MTPALILAALLAAPPAPRPCVGEIARVLDGDTVAVACPAGELVLRLADVDAPETRGCAAAHGRRVARLVAVEFGPWEGWDGVIVTVRATGRDRWGRTVGDAEIMGETWRGWLLSDAIAALGEMHGIETLRPWPHDAKGRAMAPRPDWCEEGGGHAHQSRN